MDIGASTWTEIDDNNSQAAPDGAPEGMLPSGLNNTVRAMMGAIKRWFKWSTPATTGGTSTAYTLTYAVSPGALIDGMTHLVQFHAANGAAATLSINGLGAIPLHYHAAGAWRVAPPGLFDADEIFQVMYNSAAGAYRIMRPGAERTGTVKAFAGATAPGGYLLCYGQAISRTNYVGLFTICGTTYGAGDGSTTFALPDLRGRVAAGADNMGGSAASRLTSTTMTPDGNTQGATGGAQTVTVSSTGNATGTVNVSGSTSVPVNGLGNAQGGGTGQATDWNHIHSVTASGATSLNVSASAANVNKVQPTIILNQMIAI
jgi:microcystin-dependent protein